MLTATFNNECQKRLIDPAVALENTEVRKALASALFNPAKDHLVLEALDSEF
jgi:hypothetical protein